MGQSIRPSQFITTYGPGAILEGPNGPRVINDIAQSDILKFKLVEELEIGDQRLSESLLQGAGIIRIPTNAELQLAETDEVYATKPFPSWSLCIKRNHNKLYRYQFNSFVGCPDCGNLKSSYEAWQKSRREAIRFVLACPNGHLDDVNWVKLVRHKKSSCSPKYLLWKGGGGALKNVSIACPDCGGSFNLGSAYATEHECKGRYPEKGQDTPGCDEPARMMQRGASNLRVAEIISSLTIPNRDTRLHQLLAHSSVINIIYISDIKSKEDLLVKLKALVDRRRLQANIYEEISRYDDSTILNAISDVCEPINVQNELDYRVAEFNALQVAATRGAPLYPSSTPGSPPLFEVVRKDIKTFAGPNGKKLRITPVSRLRVVMVQTGYRRLDLINGQSVDTVYHEGIKDWYPGVETFGEGIFIDFAPLDTQNDQLIMSGSEYSNWIKGFDNYETDNEENSAVKKEQLHPVFVWWHTLSHRLISSLSIDSGYSAASIRERIYIKFDEENENIVSGGILLYTTQPGGDGTLGGLIGLVPEFNKVLYRAFRGVHTCSNDPLCGEENFGPNKLNGAACYACQFVSETSCEHRNLTLDRNLLLKNLP
ncbi:DUF1998 domain-containing protein [Paenibacillus taichungensis]|uniref:DUF1998 domain-containing protein n=1 Tax=Paenibacillus taichungensis TaxID=484184 RepID=UPI00287249BF|nr:DUF1998 domain-containing protein [Paenibacillus taichungensis]MDR9749294.1 DUF1998 domain-containing protein [Paenibacillus taichungensis]